SADRKLARSTFVIERVYRAAPAKVFHAFADPATKALWFGAPTDEWKLISSAMDFREGGREHHEARRGADGPVSRFDAYYHEIIPDTRIVYSYEMRVDGARLSVSLTSIELKPGAGGSGSSGTATTASGPPSWATTCSARAVARGRRATRGGVGGGRTRRSATRCSCSPTIRANQWRWPTVLPSTLSPAASTRRWNAPGRPPVTWTSGSAAASRPSGSPGAPAGSTGSTWPSSRSCSAGESGCWTGSTPSRGTSARRCPAPGRWCTCS